MWNLDGCANVIIIIDKKSEGGLARVYTDLATVHFKVIHKEYSIF